jgi:hypothetical protein
MKKGIRIFCSLLVFSAAWLSLSYAYDNSGYGARATGLGAFVGLADDPSAVFYNPAGISQIEYPQIYFMYDKRSQFTFKDSENPYLLSGVGVYPLNQKLKVFMGGSQKGSWADPTDIVTNNQGIIGLSGWVIPHLSLGINGKFLYNSNYGKKKGADFDLGLFYRLSQKFSIGVALENALATEMIPENSDTLGYAVREGKLGIAYHLDLERYSTIFAWDLMVKNSSKPENKSYTLTSFGIEEWILTGNDLSFGLRGGYTVGKEYEQDFNQPSFGLSIKYKGESQTFQLDYSFQKYPYKTDENLTGDHRVSFSILFGGTGKKKQEYDFSQRDISERVPVPITLPEKEKKIEEKKPIAVPAGIQTFNLTSSVEELSSGRNRTIMFMLKPEFEDQIDSWKLYVCQDKPSGFETDQLKPVLLKIVDGKGLPSSGIIWDCRYNGKTLKKGTYYYAVELIDVNGQKWYSQWKTFKLK